VFLWNLAHTVYGENRFGAVAERTAGLIAGSPGFSSLCCGSAGQVYALLNQYRSTGEERWRRHAVRLADGAAAHDELAGDATTHLSLYKSHIGLALLSAELERPHTAAMPLFEFEPTVDRRQT
jgi:serine/threonine-protein kinase